MSTPEERELELAIGRVLESKSRKKLIVAGPGAGKTTLFKKLLEQSHGDQKQRLVLTFINNLKNDLERSLGELATVNTLHGYCQSLLHQSSSLRDGLTSDFRCYPGLASLIKQDWGWLRGGDPPKFVDLLRNLSCGIDQEEFYFQRSDYYNAVDFDDSVYRVYRKLNGRTDLIRQYELVLIDEFQDFNKLEAEIIRLLGRMSPIIVAGDDDQALYSTLRSASWDHIRAHHVGGEFEVFELPFCMRCPEVIVSAVNDILTRSRDDGKLAGRIKKHFRYFAPVKGEDSRLNPKIDLVHTSVQSTRANYFGRYVERIICQIPEADFRKAAEKYEPCVLIIGSRPYLPQIATYLANQGLLNNDPVIPRDERGEALMILQQDQRSNLGWRILLSDDPPLARSCVKKALENGLALADAIPEHFRGAVLAELANSAADQSETNQSEPDNNVPRILLTSYEGSKGLSAQHVVLTGLHDGELPRSPGQIKDIEICKFLVGLTRTKKKCSLISTRRFGKTTKTTSTFISWIHPRRFNSVEVNAAFWS